MRSFCKGLINRNRQECSDQEHHFEKVANAILIPAMKKVGCVSKWYLKGKKVKKSKKWINK